MKSGISVRELISTYKKKKKCRRGVNGRTFSQNHRKRGKKPLPPHVTMLNMEVTRGDVSVFACGDVTGGNGRCFSFLSVCGNVKPRWW